jgi:FkbH-like protein
MHIEFVGDIITQPLGKLTRLLPFTKPSIHHHGIDQNMQVLLTGTQADILITHLGTDYFLEKGNAQVAQAAMMDYCSAVRDVAATGGTLVIANLLPTPVQRMLGIDHLEGVRTIAALNDQLINLAREVPLVSIADLPSVLARNGHDRSISATNLLMMRMPYTGQVLPDIIGEYVRCIRERTVARKKVILVDADNTLWGGVVGEDGVNGLQVDDQYPGQIFVRFQRALLQLRDTGMLICLVTKNNEADVREAFETLDMPLRWSNFSVVRANWLPKSENIRSIAGELNLGVESMIFIDDNPFELEEVSSALPGITTHRFEIAAAADPINWLAQIDDLSAWSVTDEDRRKAVQYEQEGKRQRLAKSSTSVDDYIASLGIAIEVGCNREAHVKRISQLTNKTNQFNLTTRRYSETAILEAMREGRVFDFRVSDRFGDMGIVGIVIVRGDEIEAFLMSCRALGRKIESDILAYVLKNVTVRPIHATFSASAKNAMVERFYDDNGFSIIGEDDSGRRYCYASREQIALKNEIREIS